MNTSLRSRCQSLLAGATMVLAAGATCLHLPAQSPSPPSLSARTSPPQAPGGSGIEVHDCVVRFAQEVKVPALESGPVAAVSIQLNDTVTAGAAIAQLDNRSLLKLRGKSQRQLDLARRDAEDEREIRYAELALAETEAELDTSRSIQNDFRGAVPLSQVRKLKLAVERGKLEVDLARKRSLRAAVEVELGEADLSFIDDQLSNLRIESPIGGIVLEVSRSAGEWINKGEPIATIGRIDRLHVHALLSSSQISPAVCRGLRVSVHWIDPASGDERSLAGSVLSVDPQMLPGGRFRLHAEIENRTIENDSTQWLLQPGVEVRMTVYPSATAVRNALRSTHR